MAEQKFSLSFVDDRAVEPPGGSPDGKPVPVARWDRAR